MVIIRISFIMAALLMLASCNRVRCGPSTFSIGYSGFDSTELTVAIVKKYEPNNDFSRLVDVDTLDLNNGSNSAYQVPHAIRLYENYDWEITLPIANRTDRITELSIHKTKGQGSSGRSQNTCYNGWNYTLNGEEHRTPPYGGEFGSPQTPVITK